MIISRTRCMLRHLINKSYIIFFGCNYIHFHNGFSIELRFARNAYLFDQHIMYICESRTLSFHLSLSHIPWHCWNCNMQQTTNMIIGNWVICFISECPVWSSYLENQSNIELSFYFNIQYVCRNISLLDQKNSQIFFNKLLLKYYICLKRNLVTLLMV